ncbi:hypothetical protein Tco_0830490 [Tanacetum coccineum]
MSPNVGLEALAESLNIPEGSQDKDSLKVLTELPRSQSMKVLALLVGSLVIVVMKNEGALLHFHDMGKDHGMRKRKKSGVDSELRLNRKQQAASTTPKAVSSATKAKRAAVALYPLFSCIVPEGLEGLGESVFIEERGINLPLCQFRKKSSTEGKPVTSVPSSFSFRGKGAEGKGNNEGIRIGPKWE